MEEVTDPGQSGASLERPGMDRVRDLVATGGVSVVLAQDRDRFVREPAYHYLLRREFEERGCKPKALNDRGDESPEGDLTDGILDQLAKYERAKIAERTRRGKLRELERARSLPPARQTTASNSTPRDIYVVAQEETQIVKRIFCMVGVEGHTMRAVKHAFEREGTLAPKGGRHWNPTFLHKVILDDVCKPHTYEEVKALVTPEVAAKLRPGERYGVWWYNRTRTLESYVTEVGPNGKRYKRRRSSTEKPPSEWIVIPVPDSGIPREWVDAAREAIKENRKHPSSNRRFWELSGGILRCGCCGYVMRQDARVKSTGSWFYYGCSRRWNRGKDTYPNAKSFDVNRVEPLVWRFVSELLQAPEQLREDLERMIEQECRNLREDPDREVEVWLKKMTEVAQMRDNYQGMVARGLITFGELEEKLGQLEEGRATAERELAALEGVGSA